MLVFGAIVGVGGVILNVKQTPLSSCLERGRGWHVGGVKMKPLHITIGESEVLVGGTSVGAGGMKMNKTLWLMFGTREGVAVRESMEPHHSRLQ